MINSPGLNVFESVDEILIDISGTTPNLSAAGFYCEMDGTYMGLRLSSEIESEVRKGFEQPLVYVRCGDSEHGRKLVWFTTRTAADDLVSKVSAAYRQKKQEKGVYTPVRTSFPRRAAEWFGILMTSLCICFFGAGAANFGWKTFDPLAIRFATAHQPDLVEQAMMRREREVDQIYSKIIDVNGEQWPAEAYADRAIEKEKSLNNFKASLESVNEKMKAREKVIIQMLPEKDQ